jgi:predicted N-acetyltransferase YhbS
VLTGGELPAMVLADAVVRLIPGVIGKEGSHVNDSFSPGAERLLDHPHYTRPPEWKGRDVPSVLLSGDHKKIEAWRREQSVELTKQRRPDLLAGPLVGPSASTTTIVIRDATESDHDAIDALLRSAFDTDVEAKLVQALREQGDAPIELVAEHNGQAVGHILFSPVTIQASDGRLRPLALAPLAIEADWQGKEIDKALIQQGLRACEESRAGAVFVLGERDDYLPLGFETASQHGFTSPLGTDKAFMVRLLKPLTSPPGKVQYAPAFDVLDDA